MITEGLNYYYGHARGNQSHTYLLPVVERVAALMPDSERSVLDLGCGNGFVTNHLAQLGFAAIGIDPSDRGLQIARRAYPHVRFLQADAYDDLAGQLGSFSLVVSLEVVEHLYSPARFASTLFDVTKPGGMAVVSTPFNGYRKYLGLAALGRLDRYHQPLHEGGHIKFFSAPQLHRLLSEAGFAVEMIERVGRVSPLAKSMVAIARRP